MSIKKKYTLKEFDPETINKIDDLFETAYANKLESRFWNNSASESVQTFQNAIHGTIGFSATGSATVTQSITLPETGQVLYANAHAQSALVSAHITDVTNTTVAITLAPISASSVSEAIQTSSVNVFFQVVRAAP